MKRVRRMSLRGHWNAPYVAEVPPEESAEQRAGPDSDKERSVDGVNDLLRPRVVVYRVEAHAQLDCGTKAQDVKKQNRRCIPQPAEQERSAPLLLTRLLHLVNFRSRLAHAHTLIPLIPAWPFRSQISNPKSEIPPARRTLSI